MAKQTQYRDYQDWLLDALSSPYEPENKDQARRLITLTELNKLSSMLVYNLKTEEDNKRIYIPQINKIKNSLGQVLIVKDKMDKEFHVLSGVGTNLPDENFNYSTFSITSQNSKYTAKEVRIGENAEVIYNNSYHLSFIPLINKYATYLLETELTIYDALLWNRLTALLNARNGNEQKAIEQLLKDLKDGKLASILSDGMLYKEGIQASPITPNGYNFNSLMDLHNFWKGCLENELGLQGSRVQKRESLASEEVKANSASVIPTTDDVLNEAREGIKRCQEHWNDFPIDSVDLGSGWMIQEDTDGNNIRDLDEEKGGEEDESIESSNDTE